MSNFNNLTNYNKISLKSESAAELVRELAKLGVFKRKRKSKARAAKASDEIQQITQGMTPQQVADVQARNNAAVAILRAEVERDRFEQSRAIGNLGKTIKRFRGAQEPGAGVYDPFRKEPVVFLQPDIHEGASFTETLNAGAPELASEAVQTEVFAEEGAGEEGGPEEGFQTGKEMAFEEEGQEEGFQTGKAMAFEEEGQEEGIQTGETKEEEAMLTGKAKAFEEEEEEEEIKPRIVPRENINLTDVTSDRKRVAAYLGVKAIPPNSKKTSKAAMREYYKTFLSKSGDKIDPTIMENKGDMHKALTTIADRIFKEEIGNTISDRIFKEEFGKVGGGAF
jgi:hypothetical protein